jgi:hypothetical protein
MEIWKRNTLVIVVGVLALLIVFAVTPSGKAIWNKWFHKVQTVDDATNYETLKRVEDTCRAMIASYKSDRLTYEQYKDSTDSEKISWAEQAKMRANKTATTYNEYILKNSYVWEGNIPKDIEEKLEIIN